ncbi:unnamed protein product [Ostreobium quekettii]|uniref:Uncharacterized protein n=1 Tax=Ostreobium quekettii TaxID=121088 RepID=A0A8S1ILJ4_9CHLO|nr:unnamed protein product [Ostreobium quekettii]|eukprot:evm.model.scf_241.8 EVM.evm.TU.scf_241.8   scf_241:92734-99664(+)
MVRRSSGMSRPFVIATALGPVFTLIRGLPPGVGLPEDAVRDVVDRLSHLERLDPNVELNRSLVHAFLFVTWIEVKTLFKHCTDDYAIVSRYSLSTDWYATLLKTHHFEDHLAESLFWLPDFPNSALSLLKALMASESSLAVPLFNALFKHKLVQALQHCRLAMSTGADSRTSLHMLDNNGGESGGPAEGMTSSSDSALCHMLCKEECTASVQTKNVSFRQPRTVSPSTPKGMEEEKCSKESTDQLVGDGSGSRFQTCSTGLWVQRDSKQEWTLPDFGILLPELAPALGASADCTVSACDQAKCLLILAELARNEFEKAVQVGTLDNNNIAHTGPSISELSDCQASWELGTFTFCIVSLLQTMLESWQAGRLLNRSALNATPPIPELGRWRLLVHRGLEEACEALKALMARGHLGTGHPAVGAQWFQSCCHLRARLDLLLMCWEANGDIHGDCQGHTPDMTRIDKMDGVGVQFSERQPCMMGEEAEGKSSVPIKSTARSERRPQNSGKGRLQLLSVPKESNFVETIMKLEAWNSTAGDVDNGNRGSLSSESSYCRRVGQLEFADSQLLAWASVFITPGCPCWGPFMQHWAIASKIRLGTYNPFLLGAALLDMLYNAVHAVAGGLASALARISVLVLRGVEHRDEQDTLMRATIADERTVRVWDWLREDQQFHEMSIQSLVAGSNRLKGSGAVRGGVVVDAEERAACQAQLLRDFLPFALLAPKETIKRLLLDTIANPGQLPVSVGILRRLRTVALFRCGKQPLLLHVLQELMESPGNVLETAPRREALAALAKHITGGADPLLSRKLMMRDLVIRTANRMRSPAGLEALLLVAMGMMDMGWESSPSESPTLAMATAWNALGSETATDFLLVLCYLGEAQLAMLTTGAVKGDSFSLAALQLVTHLLEQCCITISKSHGFSCGQEPMQVNKLLEGLQVFSWPIRIRLWAVCLHIDQSATYNMGDIVPASALGNFEPDSTQHGGVDGETSQTAYVQISYAWVQLMSDLLSFGSGSEMHASALQAACSHVNRDEECRHDRTTCDQAGTEPASFDGVVQRDLCMVATRLVTTMRACPSTLFPWTLVVALAHLLPIWTHSEAQRITLRCLPALFTILVPQTQPFPPPASNLKTSTMAEISRSCLVVETMCRVVHVLAARREEVSVVGHLRAVDQCISHLAQTCWVLVVRDRDAVGGLRDPVGKEMLCGRCFREVCGLAAVLQEGFDCVGLQALLLNLMQTMCGASRAAAAPSLSPCPAEGDQPHNSRAGTRDEIVARSACGVPLRLLVQWLVSMVSRLKSPMKDVLISALDRFVELQCRDAGLH